MMHFNFLLQILNMKGISLWFVKNEIWLLFATDSVKSCKSCFNTNKIKPLHVYIWNNVCYSGATINSLCLVVYTDQQNSDKVIHRNVVLTSVSTTLLFIFFSSKVVVTFSLHSHGVVFLPTKSPHHVSFISTLGKHSEVWNVSDSLCLLKRTWMKNKGRAAPYSHAFLFLTALQSKFNSRIGSQQFFNWGVHG